LVGSNFQKLKIIDIQNTLFFTYIMML